METRGNNVGWRGVAKARQKRVHRLPKERFTFTNVERVPSIRVLRPKSSIFHHRIVIQKRLLETHRLVIQPSKHGTT